ncbi:hypothetical protein NKH77_16055 [Streptomyces sp. M19]
MGHPRRAAGRHRRAPRRRGRPPLVGDLRADLENQTVWTLTELSRPGGIAFFRAEVAPDVDERHAGMRECLRRVTERFAPVLDAAREHDGAPRPVPGRGAGPDHRAALLPGRLLDPRHGRGVRPRPRRGLVGER